MPPILTSVLVFLILSLQRISGFDDGTIVIDTGTSKGRATIAKRSFAIGELVLAESPLIVWDADDADLSFLFAFQAAPAAARATILELSHAPLDSPTHRVVAIRRSAAAALQRMAGMPGASTTQEICPASSPHLRSPDAGSDAAASGRGEKPLGETAPAGAMSLDEAHRLLLIRNTNCHPYFGAAAAPYAEAEAAAAAAGEAAAGPRREALFPRAARANHACRPNVAFSTQTADGRLEYVAVPILSFYISTTAMQNTMSMASRAPACSCSWLVHLFRFSTQTAAGGRPAAAQVRGRRGARAGRHTIAWCACCVTSSA